MGLAKHQPVARYHPEVELLIRIAVIDGQGGGIGTTINQIYRSLKEITGYQREAVYGPAKTGEMPSVAMDGSRACTNQSDTSAARPPGRSTRCISA